MKTKYFKQFVKTKIVISHLQMFQIIVLNGKQAHMKGFVLTLSYGNSLKDSVYVKSEFVRVPNLINLMLVRKKSILTSRDIQTSQVIFYTLMLALRLRFHLL